MWLHRENICEILNITDVALLAYIKKNSKTYASTKKINFIENELLNNKEKYFGSENKELEICTR